MVRTTEAYFNILSAEDNLEFTRAEKTAIARQLEQAKQRFEVGLIAITDVHEAQAAFDLGTHLARQDAPLRAIGAQVYGPAPAPIARIRGRHRVRLLVRADKGAPLQAALGRWLGQVRLTGSLRLAVDIDPQSFY